MAGMDGRSKGRGPKSAQRTFLVQTGEQRDPVCQQQKFVRWCASDASFLPFFIDDLRASSLVNGLAGRGTQSASGGRREHDNRDLACRLHLVLVLEEGRLLVQLGPEARALLPSSHLGA